MYCVGCGAQNPDAGVFCFNCGRELVASPAAVAVQQSTPVADGTPMRPPVSRQSPEPHPGAAVAAIRNEYPNLSGVGGWLLWFCIVTTVISPAIVLVSTLSHTSGYSLIDMCLAAFSVFTGVSLWKTKPRALRLTKILLIVQFCLGALLVVGELISSTDNSSASSVADPSGLRMLVGAFIWFLYFMKSKRVRAVYGRSI
jgi:hypothetical protein